MAKRKNSKKEPIFGLEKLPSKGYIKALEKELADTKVELGKANSYIAELEYNLNKLQQLSEEDLLELSKQTQIVELKKENQKLSKTNYKLNKDNKNLVHKLMQQNGSKTNSGQN